MIIRNPSAISIAESEPKGGTTFMDPRELLLLRTLRIVRKLRLSRMRLFGTRNHLLTDYFKGLEKAEAVRRIFGKKTENVLQGLRVEFTWIPGYMWISDVDGHLIVNSRYFNKGSRVDIYLDVIHELVHVKQFMEGKELFDVNYGYTTRPTEIEAYRHAVEEARRMGLGDQRICEYLKTEWMSDEGLRQLASSIKVKCDRK